MTSEVQNTQQGGKEGKRHKRNKGDGNPGSSREHGEEGRQGGSAQTSTPTAGEWFASPAEEEAEQKRRQAAERAQRKKAEDSWAAKRAAATADRLRKEKNAMEKNNLAASKHAQPLRDMFDRTPLKSSGIDKRKGDADRSQGDRPTQRPRGTPPTSRPPQDGASSTNNSHTDSPRQPEADAVMAEQPS